MKIQSSLHQYIDDNNELKIDNLINKLYSNHSLKPKVNILNKIKDKKTRNKNNKHKKSKNLNDDIREFLSEENIDTIRGMSKDRLDNYKQLKLIVELIPEMREILKVMTSTTMSPDSFIRGDSQLVNWDTSDKQLSSSLNIKIKAFIEKYDLETIVFKAIEESYNLGDSFVYVEDGKNIDAFVKKYIKMKSAKNFSKKMLYESLDIDNWEAKLRKDKVDNDDFSFMSEKVNVIENIDEKKLVDIMEMITEKSGKLTEEKLSDELSNITSDVMVHRLPPENVFIMKIHNRIIGYIYVRVSKEKQYTDDEQDRISRLFKQISDKYTGENSETNSDQITKKFINIISDKITSNGVLKPLKDNKDFRNLIYNIHRENELLTKKLAVTFIYPEDIVHFTPFSKNDEGYGNSIFSSIIFFTKIYLATLVSNLFAKLKAGQTNRVYWIETGLEGDGATAVNGFINDMKKKNISFNNTGSVSSVLQNLTAHKEIFIPTVEGQKVVDFDTYEDVTNVNADAEFLEFLKDSMIKGSPVPEQYISTATEVDFARSLTMTNGNFAKTIITEQKNYNKLITKLYRLISVKMYNDTDDTILFNKINYQLSPPLSLDIENISNIVMGLKEIADTFSEMSIDDELKKYIENNEDEDYIINKLKLDYMKKFLPSFNWDNIDSVIDDTKQRYKVLSEMKDDSTKDDDKDEGNDGNFNSSSF